MLKIPYTDLVSELRWLADQETSSTFHLGSFIWQGQYSNYPQSALSGLAVIETAKPDKTLDTGDKINGPNKCEPFYKMEKQITHFKQYIMIKNNVKIGPNFTTWTFWGIF